MLKQQCIRSRKDIDRIELNKKNFWKFEIRSTTLIVLRRALNEKDLICIINFITNNLIGIIQFLCRENWARNYIITQYIDESFSISWPIIISRTKTQFDT